MGCNGDRVRSRYPQRHCLCHASSLIFDEKLNELKEHIEKVKGILANKDQETAESIKTATNELQQASLKLFEMAYKKVS